MALTAKEQRELDQLELQKLQAEKAATSNQASEEVGPKDTLGKLKQAAVKGLGVIGKGLDYAGGVTRTAGAYPFVKNVTSQDVLNAIKAKPLSGEEILNKGGVEKGGSLSDIIPSAYSPTGDEWFKLQKGGWADPTKRGAEGLALEMATDPLALLGGVAGRTAKTAIQSGRVLTPSEKVLQVVSRPIGYGLEEAGKARYASALRKVDRAAEAANQLPVSPVLIQNGMPIGNYTQLENKLGELQSQVGQNIGNIRNQASKKGATVNMLPALDEAMNQASIWRQSPHPDIQAAAQKLDSITESYLGKGESVPVDKATQWATEANNLGKQVFGITQAPLSAEGNVAIGQGLAKESTKAIEGISPEIKNQYRLLNKQYSALAGQKAQNQLASLAKTEQSKNGISAVDAMLGGLAAAGGGHPAAVAPLIFKKAVEFSNSPYGRTLTGSGLYNIGHYGDQVLRRPSIWRDLYNKSNNGDKQ